IDQYQFELLVEAQQQLHAAPHDLPVAGELTTPAVSGVQHEPAGTRRAAAQAGPVRGAPDVVPRRLGRLAQQVRVQAALGYPVDDGVDGEDGPRGGRTEVEVEIAHIAALQSPAVHDVAAGDRAAGAALVGGGEHQHGYSPPNRSERAAASRSRSRNTSLTRTNAVPGWSAMISRARRRVARALCSADRIAG